MVTKLVLRKSWQDTQNQPNIRRVELEFFICGFSYCAPGFRLSGKLQRGDEMIIASLQVP